MSEASNKVGQVINIEWNNYGSPGFVRIRYEEWDTPRLIDEYNLNINRVSDGVVYKRETGAANVRVNLVLYIFTQARDDVKQWANQLLTVKGYVEEGLICFLEAEFATDFVIPEIPGIEHAKNWWLDDEEQI